MSPLIYDPHRCDLPMRSWIVGAAHGSQPLHSIGAIWECDECGQQWRVTATDVLERFFGSPRARWVPTKDQRPMHAPIDTEKETRP